MGSPLPTAALLIALLPAARTQETGLVRRSLGAMGTWLDLEVEANDRPAALAASEAAVRAVEAAEARLSTWRADTELARWNTAAPGEPGELSPALARDLGRALELARRTDGAFDPTCGALVTAYALRGRGRWPSEAELAEALASTGYRHLRLEGSALARTRPGVRIEEGGFGKGAGLDDALDALRAAGVRSACLDLGGQVAFLGAARSFPLADPRDRGRAVLRVRLEPGSFATTSNSERGLVVDGRPLGHVLDPRTGLPAEDHGSASVWAPDALTADALSTALFVAGPEEALAFAAREPGVEVITIEPVAGRLRVRASGGLLGRVQALTPDVELELAQEETGGPRTGAQDEGTNG